MSPSFINAENVTFLIPGRTRGRHCHDDDDDDDDDVNDNDNFSLIVL